MPSLFTHLFVGGTLGTLGPTSPYSGRILVGAALCSALPDADAIGFWLGIPYNSVLGHRGISHSLVAAIIIGCCATSVIYRRLPDRRSLPTVAILTLATASHGLLDALTNGGLGIAFLAPVVNERYFFPWRPIEVAPLGIRGFFSAHGGDVFLSELLVVWIPVALGVGAVRYARRVSRARQSLSSESR